MPCNCVNSLGRGVGMAGQAQGDGDEPLSLGSSVLPIGDARDAENCLSLDSTPERFQLAHEDPGWSRWLGNMAFSPAQGS
jgi:hypothetical protein